MPDALSCKRDGLVCVGEDAREFRQRGLTRLREDLADYVGIERKFSVWIRFGLRLNWTRVWTWNVCRSWRLRGLGHSHD